MRTFFLAIIAILFISTLLGMQIPLEQQKLLTVWKETIFDPSSVQEKLIIQWAVEQFTTMKTQFKTQEDMQNLYFLFEYVISFNPLLINKLHTTFQLVHTNENQALPLAYALQQMMKSASQSPSLSFIKYCTLY